MAADELLELLAQGRAVWNEANARATRSADLAGADLTACHLVLFDLAGANLSGADLRGVQASGATLDRATLDGVLADGASLSGATLRGASLRGASLRGVDLRDAKLDGADLTGGDLREARLDGCRLVNARLDRAMTGPGLERAILHDSSEVWPELGGDRIHQLRLRVDVAPQRPHWPVVTVLIDGDDVLALEGSIGFDPDDLFAQSEPLVPTSPPRRIAVYRCTCGEAGCSCIAPLIVDAGDTVHWRDFRDFTGVYVRPDTDTQPSGGRTLGIPDMRFNSGQYVDEVRRAAIDRSWESHGREVARLVRTKLRRESGHFEQLGYRLGWVGPYEEGTLSVSLAMLENGATVGQTVVKIGADDGAAEAVATTLADQLVSTPESGWLVTHRNRFPRTLS